MKVDTLYKKFTIPREEDNATKAVNLNVQNLHGLHGAL